MFLHRLQGEKNPVNINQHGAVKREKNSNGLLRILFAMSFIILDVSQQIEENHLT